MTYELMHGDALESLRRMPDNSVALIATDPPYHRVKNEAWDRQWKDVAAFLDWIGELCVEWRRVLKPNGSLYCFASPQMSARVECKIGEYFNVLNNIRWVKEAGWHQKAEKESLRSYLEPWEACVFAEQGSADAVVLKDSGYDDATRELHKRVYSPLADYIRMERERSGLSRSDVEVALGFCSRSDPTKGTALCYRWEEGSSLPTKETYERLRAYLNRKGGSYFTREYEYLRRPFAVTANVPYTDVWTFPTVQGYDGKHVCEKPLAMMEHIVTASSRPGDTVLDCFMGSGTTGLAAVKHGRSFIGIELDAHWVEQSRRRIEEYLNPQQLRLIEPVRMEVAA